MLFRLLPWPTRAAIAASMIAFAGCETRHHGDEIAQAVDQGEHLAMQGFGTFFDGQLSATVAIGRGIGRGMARGAGGSFASRSEEETKGMDTEQTAAYIRSKGAMGSPMPPVTLHLRLTNLTKGTISVEIDDFESDLGNFAVHPEVLALAPDQIAEPDPMVSQLGVTSNQIPVKVTLKLGAKTETQTLIVTALPGGGAYPTGGK